MRGRALKLAGEFVNSFLDNKVGRALNPFPFTSGSTTNPLNLFNKESLTKLANMSPKDWRHQASGYFKGRQYNAIGAGPGADNPARAAIRKRAAWIGGGLLAANVLDLDPVGITTAAGTVGALGAHGLTGLAIRKMSFRHSKLAGNAYLAATAINTFRGGDNMGMM